MDRAQTAGPGTLNVPTEKIYELGNYESVATVRDTPDLTFSLESLDVSAEIEAMLLGVDFAAAANGTELDMIKALPLNVASQFKAGRTATNAFDTAASVVIPYLNMESISYRFGLRDNASQAISLRGDSVIYAGGSAYQQSTAGAGTANQVIAFANAPLPYNGDALAGVKYALGVSLKSGKRLVKGVDYTETAPTTGATPTTGSITVLAAVPTTDFVLVTGQERLPRP